MQPKLQTDKIEQLIHGNEQDGDDADRYNARLQFADLIKRITDLDELNQKAYSDEYVQKIEKENAALKEKLDNVETQEVVRVIDKYQTENAELKANQILGRCKDCKYYDDILGAAQADCTITAAYVLPDHYCGNWTKKERRMDTDMITAMLEKARSIVKKFGGGNEAETVQAEYEVIVETLLNSIHDINAENEMTEGENETLRSQNTDAVDEVRRLAAENTALKAVAYESKDTEKSSETAHE